MKNKILKKFKVLFNTFLALVIFCFTFSIFNLDPKKDVVLAEEITSGVTSRYVPEELSVYIDGAVENSSRTFDYFDLYQNSEKYITDEWLILYSFDLMPLDEHGSIITNLSVNTSDLSGTVYNCGFTINTSVNSYVPYSYIGLQSRNDSVLDETQYTSLAYWLKPKITTSPNFDYWLGSMFYFDSNFTPSFINDSIPDFASSNSYKPMYYDASTQTYRDLIEYFYFTSSDDITFTDVTNYISAKFIPLSDVINYAYSNGYEHGLSTLNYGMFGYGATYDVEMIFSNIDDTSLPDKTYTLTNQPLRLKDGFTDFTSLYQYSEVQFNSDGSIIPSGSSSELDLYIWDSGTITINVSNPVTYNSNNIGGFISPLSGADLYLKFPDSTERWVGTEMVDGRLCNPVLTDYNFGILYKLRLGTGGRASDILPSISLKDFSANVISSWNNGYSAGYNIGYESGREDTYPVAKREGYTEGYADGLRADNAFYTFFSAVIDVPVKSFSSMFNFEILGVNMLGFLKSLLTVSLIICIVRLFLK